MMFGADHLHPTSALDPLTPLPPKASGYQAHNVNPDPDLGGHTVHMCQSARMNKLKADLNSHDQQALTQVHL